MVVASPPGETKRIVKVADTKVALAFACCLNVIEVDQLLLFFLRVVGKKSFYHPLERKNDNMCERERTLVTDGERTWNEEQ